MPSQGQSYKSRKALSCQIGLKWIVRNCPERQPSQLGLGSLPCPFRVSLWGKVKKHKTNPPAWVICVWRLRHHAREGRASDHKVRRRPPSSQPVSLPWCRLNPWCAPRREASADLCYLLARTQPQPEPHQRPPRESRCCLLLEFIAICSFRLLSRIIVLLGLRAWEGRRCALLFINSLNACFKLKPAPHAGSHRNNIKTHYLPAFCYQCQSDLSLLFFLLWGHPFRKHQAKNLVPTAPNPFFFFLLYVWEPLFS